MSSSVFDVKTHILPCQYIRDYPGATLDDQEARLLLHVKQYTPRKQKEVPPNAVTIIGAHANGFPKELYEPLWDEMYERSKKGHFAIRGIWIADVASQGKSYVLNEYNLGNDPSWMDHARDLLYMINHFRDHMSRPLIGIGHSMGGAQLVNLSLMHPRLLTTLILFDPVMQLAPHPPVPPGGSTYTRMSTFRRDIWPSRSVAAASFQKSRMHSSWDPRVLSLWNKYGLRDLPTAIHPLSSSSPTSSAASEPPVTLTTPKHQEVFTFLRPHFTPLDPLTGHPVFSRATHPDLDTSVDHGLTHPFYRPEPTTTLRNLPHLRPSTLYIFGGTSEMSPPDWRREKVETTGVGVGGSGGVKEGRVKGVVMEDVGHLIPMIVPGLCAEKAVEWLDVEIARWTEEEERWKRGWLGRTKRERQMVSKEWEKMVGGDPRKGGKL